MNNMPRNGTSFIGMVAMLVPAAMPMAAADPSAESAPAPARVEAPSLPAEEPTCLVGAYYFAGWWKNLPNKYVVAGRDWRREFPERIPTLGEYNEQSTMDREIVAAAEHGISFFQILWYPQPDPDRPDPQVDRLDVAVAQFMKSPNARRMRFTVEYCNHDPFSLQREEDWEAAYRVWFQAMKHPSYLRIDGRPVFKIHSLHHFLKQNGNDQARVEARVRAIRQAAQRAGLNDPIIGAGVSALGVPPADAARPYDFLVTYMDVPALPQQASPYPYEKLLQMAEKSWELCAKHSSRAYVPYIPSGWDPRPWKDPRASFELPTNEQWKAALQKAKAALDAHANFGIPRANGKIQKTLLIYAWNEFAEGGFLAPTRGYGTMKLECIREVFDGKQPARRTQAP